MLSVDSPFLNIPAALDRKQAVFLDGMRHAGQIVELSYTRLCQALTDLSASGTAAEKSAGFTHVFLDAWAFIDATDRFRCLWEMQPSASDVPPFLSSTAVWSPIPREKEIGREEAFFGRADHRFPA